jgi:hypothetical protein
VPKNILRLKSASCYYDLDDYLFNRVTKRFTQRRTLSDFDFYVIITWKANRMTTTVKKGLQADGIRPSQLMSEVFDIDDDRDKMRRLDRIPGIGMPIASAILTVCYPDRFTVLDYRAWDTLRDYGRVVQKKMPTGLSGYFDDYLPVCMRLAEESGMPLRMLDRALWGWSKRQGVLRVAGR